MAHSQTPCPICNSGNAPGTYFCAGCGRFIFDITDSGAPVHSQTAAPQRIAQTVTMQPVTPQPVIQQPVIQQPVADAHTPSAPAEVTVRADGMYKRCQACGNIVEVTQGERYLRCPVCKTEGIRDAATIPGSALLGQLQPANCTAGGEARQTGSESVASDKAADSAAQSAPAPVAESTAPVKLTLRETLSGALIEIPKEGAVLDANSMLCRTYIASRLGAFGTGGVEIYVLGKFWYIKKRGAITLKSNGFAVDEERMDDGDRLLIGESLELTVHVG